MRTKAAAISGVVALAATTGILFAATSASAYKCPPPTQPVGDVRGIQVCGIGGPIIPGCDPGPCDPTAAAPQE